MKVKSILSVMGICALVLSSCGQGQGEAPKEDFDAAAYTTAYLNSLYKGDTAAYAELSGKAEADITASYDENVNKWVSLVIGTNTNEPGSSIIAPELAQSYTDVWKNILGNTKYEVTKAEKNGDDYTVTLDTQQMDLYAKVQEGVTAKGDNLYEGIEDTSDTVSAYAQAMLGIYQDAAANLSYADAGELTVTLTKADDTSWSISPEDITALDAKLIDKDTLSNGVSSDAASGAGSDAPAEEVQTEATPNQVYPDNLDEVTSYNVGDTISLQQNGQEVASFVVDSVKVTDERSQYDPSNPEKVVVIQYTYQNIAFEYPILYDQMSFQLLDGDTVCEPYYIESLISPNIAEVGKEPITASLAYGVSADCQEVIVYIDGSQIDQPFQLKVSLS
jgi:hypothetical protein